jgi:hypothetical protein
MASNPAVLSAAKALGASLDVYDVNPDQTTQLKMAADIGGSIRELVDDLAAHGQIAVQERLSALLGRELRKEELAALSGGLSPDVVNSYRDRWFVGVAQKERSVHRADQLNKVAAGGWVRDDVTLSLRYQPTGHADPWLRAWLDLLAEAASGPNAAMFDPLLQTSMKPTAVGLCGSCHSVERDKAGRLAIQWRPFDPLRERPEFTRFDHGPHVIQPETGDCQACHRIRSSNGAAAYASYDPHQFISGFEAMDKSACAACHTQHGAGDGCTQCHSYHGDGT